MHHSSIVQLLLFCNSLLYAADPVVLPQVLPLCCHSNKACMAAGSGQCRQLEAQ